MPPHWPTAAAMRVRRGYVRNNTSTITGPTCAISMGTNCSLYATHRVVELDVEQASGRAANIWPLTLDPPSGLA